MSWNDCPLCGEELYKSERFKYSLVCKTIAFSLTSMIVMPHYLVIFKDFEIMQDSIIYSTTLKVFRSHNRTSIFFNILDGSSNFEIEPIIFDRALSLDKLYPIENLNKLLSIS